ncbi:MAG: guanylate kinase [Chthonomonas sp.]|nr:guanylate kinase [Chthonomonas sp.]
MSGRLIIFSGPSGVGKDTILVEWGRVNERIQRVISYTTRSKREGEIEGLDYHFVTRERFQEMAAEGAFLEYKEVYGNLYATPLHDMNAMIEAGACAVLKIDVAGALDAMELRPDALTIFVMPPSIEELDRRIRGRGSDSPEQIERRLAAAHAEIEHAPRYQHRVVNDDLDRVIQELESIVSRECVG